MNAFSSFIVPYVKMACRGWFKLFDFYMLSSSRSEHVHPIDYWSASCIGLSLDFDESNVVLYTLDIWHRCLYVYVYFYIFHLAIAYSYSIKLPNIYLHACVFSVSFVLLSRNMNSCRFLWVAKLDVINWVCSESMNQLTWWCYCADH